MVAAMLMSCEPSRTQAAAVAAAVAFSAASFAAPFSSSVMGSCVLAAALSGASGESARDDGPPLRPAAPDGGRRIRTGEAGASAFPREGDMGRRGHETSPYLGKHGTTPEPGSAHARDGRGTGMLCLKPLQRP